MNCLTKQAFGYSLPYTPRHVTFWFKKKNCKIHEKEKMNKNEKIVVFTKHHVISILFIYSYKKDPFFFYFLASRL